MDTYSVRSGNAMVWDETAGELRVATVEECERMMGLRTGATAAPGLTETQRRALCGNMIDVHALRCYIFGEWRKLQHADREPLTPATCGKDESLVHSQIVQSSTMRF